MTVTASAIAGAASITIDGASYNVSGEASYQVSGSKREPLVGQDGFHGFSSMPQPGKISFKGRDTGVLSISALSEAVDVTVVLSLANGKTIIGRNMARMGEGPLSVNTEDSTFEVEFIGPDVTEA